MAADHRGRLPGIFTGRWIMKNRWNRVYSAGFIFYFFFFFFFFFFNDATIAALFPSSPRTAGENRAAWFHVKACVPLDHRPFCSLSFFVRPLFTKRARSIPRDSTRAITAARQFLFLTLSKRAWPGCCNIRRRFRVMDRAENERKARGFQVWK